jgi:hypothetical protein
MIICPKAASLNRAPSWSDPDNSIDLFQDNNAEPNFSTQSNLAINLVRKCDLRLSRVDEECDDAVYAIAEELAPKSNHSIQVEDGQIAHNLFSEVIRSRQYQELLPLNTAYDGKEQEYSYAYCVRRIAWELTGNPMSLVTTKISSVADAIVLFEAAAKFEAEIGDVSDYSLCLLMII